MNNTVQCFIVAFLMGAIFISCNQQKPDSNTQSGLNRQDFQTLVNGDSTDLFTIFNAKGMQVSITNYGGRIVSLLVPDKSDQLLDVVLGFDHIDDYVAMPSSFGATMGRVTNRIGYGQFVLDGDTIKLDKNNGLHTIHGGGSGWRQQVFDAIQPNDSTLILSYLSPDGEAGFPGNVNVTVKYTVTATNALVIDYAAQTDKKTVINMTNHSFFNLSGNPENSILDNILYVNANHFTPIDTSLITTGEILPVAGTPFDFNKPLPIKEAITRDSTNEQLQLVGGLDHNWVLNTAGNPAILAAKLYAPSSGIALEVYTNEPGIQVYTGNMLDGSQSGKGGHPFNKQTAVCLETQHFPDAPNKPEWPSIVLTPDAVYHSTCIYQFTATQQ
ncbi:aldose epimerase family protein [Olivibacter domesticus]|uniref:Aldose 1-epimerase n=1 Tax=Olivibacter domesticus TaxID=407022 RepID=A0A1H7W8N2_OLID1|nr:aldose epimerase family protein [Olivibacter domesticus]SEM17860.1 aldose 1-epimerase [Olivibacter domesticus]